MSHVIANKLIDNLNIAPDSALAALARYACQPTKFRRVPNRKPMQREAGKQLNRFRSLLTTAVLVGVTEANLIAASRANLRLSKVKSSDGEIKVWSGEFVPRSHLYRVVACDLLEHAIDEARREKYVAVRDQEYSLAELKRIADKAGSRFFKDLAKGERAVRVSKTAAPGKNYVKVMSRAGCKYYEFVPLKGDMIFIGNELPH